MNHSHDAYLALGAALFVIGGLGFVTRRNLILMLLCTELMLHGVSLTLLAFGHIHGSTAGQAFTVFVLTVAACEAGIGLALVLSLYQRAKSLDVSLWNSLRDPGLDLPEEEFEELPDSGDESYHEFPSLATAGMRPTVDPNTPLGGQKWPDEQDYGSPETFVYGPQSKGQQSKGQQSKDPQSKPETTQRADR